VRDASRRTLHAASYRSTSFLPPFCCARFARSIRAAEFSVTCCNNAGVVIDGPATCKYYDPSLVRESKVRRRAGELDMIITPTKLAATVVAVVIFSVGVALHGARGSLVVALGLLAALSLVWFSEQLGEITGWGTIRVDQRSPGIVIAAIGWLALVGLALLLWRLP
jgi:hypothetical protein